MYILTGELKGKKLKVPKGKFVRPTSGRVKKSIFDTIKIIDKDTKVLDIFSGSGGLGIEALSRGANYAVFVEINRAAAEILNENIESCGYKYLSKILNFDFKKALSILRKSENKFDLIFIDPPYEIYEKISINDLINLSGELLDKNGMFIIEHNTKAEVINKYFTVKTKKYGETKISYLWRKN
ncbi:MAG: 16S rRNA (guanine(966)-N(2))-methyltransferase RsmD [Thermodesulfobacteriota bacterium]